jgi:hypothetical protein
MSGIRIAPDLVGARYGKKGARSGPFLSMIFCRSTWRCRESLVAAQKLQAGAGGEPSS